MHAKIQHMNDTLDQTFTPYNQPTTPSVLQIAMRPHLALIGAGSYGDYAKRLLNEAEIEVTTLPGRETYEALLNNTFRFEDHPADFVYIATPNFTHYAIVRAALEAKKHVLCEKPLALEPEQVEELYQIAAIHGCYLGVGFVLPHHPFYKKIKELQEVWGPITHIEVHNHATEAKLEPTWYWQEELSGGWFLVAEVHWFQLFAWLTREHDVTVLAGEHKTEGHTDTTWAKLFQGGTECRLSVKHKLNMDYSTAWAKVEISYARGQHAVIDNWVPHTLSLSEEIASDFPDYIVQDGTIYTDTRPRDDRYAAMIRTNINSLLNKESTISPESILFAHAIARKAQTEADRKIKE
jgi:predicted dehydrogenase